MPRLRGSGKNQTKSVSIRIAADQIDMLRHHANLRGVPLATYLARMLIAGVMAESVHDIEERMRGMIDSIPTNVGGGGVALPDEITLSVLTCEELLTEIVRDKNIEAMRRAQDTAKARLAKLKGA